MKGLEILVEGVAHGTLTINLDAKPMEADSEITTAMLQTMHAVPVVVVHNHKIITKKKS